MDMSIQPAQRRACTTSAKLSKVPYAGARTGPHLATAFHGIGHCYVAQLSLCNTTNHDNPQAPDNTDESKLIQRLHMRHRRNNRANMPKAILLHA